MSSIDGSAHDSTPLRSGRFLRAAEGRRRVRLAQCAAAFARLRRDPAAWDRYQADRQASEGTLADGLGDDTAEEVGEDERWELVEAEAR